MQGFLPRPEANYNGGQGYSVPWLKQLTRLRHSHQQAMMQIVHPNLGREWDSHAWNIILNVSYDARLAKASKAQRHDPHRPWVKKEDLRPSSARLILRSLAEFSPLDTVLEALGQFLSP
jgi:hypothetical protein